MKTKSSAAVSSIEYALLGLLVQRPMHGYELHREMSKKSGLGLIWTVKQAQLYAILAKLEAERLITAEVIAQRARPARRVLRLTEEGQRFFSIWVATPAERKDFRLVFLAKLYFARREDIPAAHALIMGQRERCDAWLEEMRARRTADAAESLDGFVYRYRIGQLGAMIAWLDESAELLRRDGIGECVEKETLP